MTENEKRFLTELHDLMRSYNIDTVLIKGSATSNDPQRIAFYSNDREFSFVGYREGSFISIISETAKYTPYLEEDKDLIVQCALCKHLKEKTPLGKTVAHCGWCDKRDRSISYTAKCVCNYYEEIEEAEKHE